MSTLKEDLAKKLKSAELALVPSSFDLIGDIAIFNKLPAELRNVEKLIATTLLRRNPHIRVVAKKIKNYAGRLRTPKIFVIAGEHRRETIHKENGVELQLDVEKCYFSPRLATERMRIAKLVKKGEDVLVLFSGVGPYVCVIAKNTQANTVYGIELGRTAHIYAIKNIKRNKIQNATLYQGDVKNILPTIDKKFDRIIMPLPKTAEKYLSLAAGKLKPKGTIHLYSFAEDKDLDAVRKKYQSKFSEANLVICGAYAPRVNRICLDLKL